MSQLRHPNIVQFLGVAYLPRSPIPVLLMEKLQTSLDNLLETSPNIPLDVKVHLLTGTAQGVVYLHSHTPPIAHRDLTARNILIDSGLTAKITDLGVARMVNIQPGQLAATMTVGPGNYLYMPQETVQEEGATRYNTAIDIFSFGVVSLFTLTQTFPKDLKPHNYHDLRTGRIIGRSEIERREHYIQLMQAALGETHPLVKLTLNCLEYLPENRPSAVEVLRRLKEVGRTIPRNCTETKLELIQQISRKDNLITRKEEEIRGSEVLIQQIQVEHRRQLTECQAQLRENQEKLSEKEEEVRQKERQLFEKDRQLLDKDAQNKHLQVTVDLLQFSGQLRSLQQIQVEHQRQLTECQVQLREKEEKLRQSQRQISEKDRQLFDKDAQIKRLQVTVDSLQLSGQLRSLELQLRVEGSQGSRQRDVSVASPKKVGPTSTYRGCPSHTCLLELRKISLPVRACAAGVECLVCLSVCLFVCLSVCPPLFGIFRRSRPLQGLI